MSFVSLHLLGGGVRMRLEVCTACLGCLYMPILSSFQLSTISVRLLQTLERFRKDQIQKAKVVFQLASFPGFPPFYACPTRPQGKVTQRGSLATQRGSLPVAGEYYEIELALHM